MKIVHIFWSLGFGGIETMLVNIANEQTKMGVDVNVVFINDLIEKSLKNAFDSSVNVVILGRHRGGRGFGFLWKLHRVLNSINPDVIHLHDSALYSLLVGTKYSRVASTTLHALPSGTIRRRSIICKLFPALNILKQDGNTRMIDLVPKTFAISQAVHDALLEKYGVKSVVINNGILTRQFKIRNINKVISNRLKIVMVSRLEHDKKGQDLLINAAALIPGVDVDFIGIGNSHDYLQELIDKLGVEDRIRLLGKRDQAYIREHLCDYDLFVQPSRYEGFGLTVAEAMAAQVPVMVSSGQGPAEVTCNNKYGWVFENGDVNDLVRMLNYLLGHYSEALNKAVIARDYVLDTYDVSVTAKKYIEHYL